MEITKSKSQCCGCEACSQVCPKQCITMIMDNEGFRYPVVDEVRCIRCGKCKNVCPNRKRFDMAQYKTSYDTYLAYSRDEVIRLGSSSGGLFSVLAKYVLKAGGAVCGAALRNGAVYHELVDTLDGLERLRGSKYLQSNMGDCYQKVKMLLIAGRKVLFSGTECQVEGLLQFLGQTSKENLITVDVFCHGVPSELAWKVNLDALQNETGKKVISIDFRNKQDEGWKRYHVRYGLEDGSEINHFHGSDFFISSFIKNIDLRPSCHACVYKQFPRQSDFSIGDAWNCDVFCREIDTYKGLSVLVINSAKGAGIFSEICSELIAMKVKLDTAVPPMSDARKPVKPHPNRKEFFAALNDHKNVEELQKLLKRTRLQRMRRVMEQGDLYIYRFLVRMRFRINQIQK